MVSFKCFVICIVLSDLLLVSSLGDSKAIAEVALPTQWYGMLESRESLRSGRINVKVSKLDGRSENDSQAWISQSYDFVFDGESLRTFVKEDQAGESGEAPYEYRVALTPGTSREIPSFGDALLLNREYRLPIKEVLALETHVADGHFDIRAIGITHNSFTWLRNRDCLSTIRGLERLMETSFNEYSDQSGRYIICKFINQGGRLEYLLSEEVGFMPVSVSVFVERSRNLEGLLWKHSVIWNEISPGLYFPKLVQITNGEGEVMEQWEIAITNVNQPVDMEEFGWAALGLPEGALVQISYFEDGKVVRSFDYQQWNGQSLVKYNPTETRHHDIRPLKNWPRYWVVGSLIVISVALGVLGLFLKIRGR